MSVTRRQVLVGATATGVAGVAPRTMSRVRAQATGAGDYGGAKPADAELTFDEDWLAAHQPVLGTRQLDVEPSQMYAFRATHPGEATDVGVYFTYYTRQEGVSREDSHYLDREPFYVFVDSESGGITSVRYAAYHWLKGESSDPPLVEDDLGTHPTARVVKRWHHYVLGSGLWTDDDPPPLGNLLEKHSPHLDNGSTAFLDTGWREALRVGAVVDPWIMQDADDWWREDVGGVSFAAERRRLEIQVASIAPFEFEGTDETDLIDGGTG